MKNRLPKAVSRLISLLPAVLLLAGCSLIGIQQSNTSLINSSLAAAAPSPATALQKPVGPVDFWAAPVVTFMKRDVSTSKRSVSGLDEKDNPYSRYIFDKTGIRVEIQYQPVDGYAEKVQLVLASGDAPDIIDLTGSDEDAINTARSGALEPINSYAGKFVNLMRVYNDEYWKSVCFDSNKYFLKSQYVLPVSNKCTLIRQDWLDMLNLKMPSTVSELYNIARAFAAAKPDGQKDTYGLIARKPLDNFWALSAAYGNPSGATGKPYIYIDKAHKKLSLWNTSDAARAYYKEVEKWWNEGLIDKESLTITSGQFWNKINNGQVGIISHSAESTGWLTTWIRQTQKNKRPTLAVIPSLKGSGYINQYGVEGGYEQTESFEGFWGFPKGNRNVENVLKVYDFECSPEFTDFVIFGLKGLEYEENGGRKVFNSDYKQAKSFSDDYVFTFDKADMTPEQKEAMFSKFAVGDTDYDPAAESLARLKKAFQSTATMSVPLQTWIPLIPKMPVEDIHPDVDTTILDLSIKLITGELEAGKDTDWNTYLRAVDDSGISLIIKQKEDYLLENYPQFFQ